jgi:hypothetical protein
MKKPQPPSGDASPEIPANIQEFNTIAALIFAQLYRAFPIMADLDKNAIGKAMAIEPTDWNAHILPSGRNFGAVLGNTILWLIREDYIRSIDGHPGSPLALTSKGLAAMNVVPSGLKQSVGTALAQSAQQPSLDLSKIGDLIGGTIGGFTKTMAG